MTTGAGASNGGRRFDGRVAVVTGAGRGIGRAHARLLAELGASVVVNDLGGAMGGDGVDEATAARAAADIRERGGMAVDDHHDVADPDGAAALIARAVDAFGRIDVVINNAGIMRWARLPDLDLTSLDRHLAVHVGGSFNTVRAAWPHLVEQGYGRIVNTTSAGMFGLPDNLPYATAKAGVVGMTKSLATLGAEHGIRVNALAPAAMTRMAGRAAGGTDPVSGPDGEGPMAPELVAPMAAFLAHEDCPVTGEVYAAGAGRFSRIVIASTPGYVHDGPVPTIDDVAAAWSTVHDEAGATIPADLLAWSAAFTRHL